jgi:hypothetical protein
MFGVDGRCDRVPDIGIQGAVTDHPETPTVMLDHRVEFVFASLQHRDGCLPIRDRAVGMLRAREGPTGSIVTL